MLKKSTEYLYGEKLDYVAQLPFVDATCVRIYKAKQVLHQVVMVDGMKDTKRLSDVAKAIKHNEGLLVDCGVQKTQVSKFYKDTVKRLETQGVL